MTSSAGARFRSAIKQKNDNNQPLQIVGAINAYTAMMATQVGHQALYLSGAGVANASFGLPDLGMTSLDNVLEDARRITDAVETPLLVDIDTGFGGAFNIAQTIKKMEKAGVAAVHIEDQVAQKRCGHRPNKEIVSISEMVDRLKAALNVYQHLLDDGTQEKVVDTMQTRMELYDFLNYHEFEQTLDKLFANSK